MIATNLPDRAAFALSASPLSADDLGYALVAGRHEIASALDLLRSRGIAFSAHYLPGQPWALTRRGRLLVEQAMAS